MKIIITFPSTLSGLGGGPVGCREIAKHLRQLGADIIILPVSRGLNGRFEEEQGVVKISPSKLHYLLDGMNIAKYIRNMISKEQIDAIIGFSHEAAFLPNLPLFNRTVFGMIAAHPSYEKWFNRRTFYKSLKNRADKWFRHRPLQRANVVFALSEFTRRELTNICGVKSSKIVTAYWGVDPLFQQVRHSLMNSVSHLIFFGSLAPLKGVFDVLESLGQVAAAGWRQWVLKIVGWGDRELVWQKACRCGIENQVMLLDPLDHKSLVRELAWAHLAVLPSHSESFGLAIAEAQAAGLAVVSYAAGSVPEVVQNGVTAWLVPPQQTDLLAKAIIEAMANPAKTFSMGLAGRKRISELFSWENTAKQMLEAIGEVKKKKAIL